MEAGGEEIMTAKTPDKIKRDEWSEGGVMSLIDVYESKWMIRNRAKLKGNDWEEIAQQVSVRGCGTKPLKTPNQCKNKIESMKKRYRAESVGNNNSVSGSSWQFFPRMDGLLNGVKRVADSGPQELSKVEMYDSENVVKQLTDAGPAIDIEAEAQIQEGNQNDDGSNTLPDNRKESRGMNSDISTPRSKIAVAEDGSERINPFKRRKSSSSDVAECIKLLAHSILKIEQTRMEMYRDSERVRAEVEMKRGEMELKRTEIIAKTQLEIAKLFAKRPRCHNKKSESSSSKAEPTVLTDTEGENGS